MISLKDRLKALLQRCESAPAVDIPTQSIEHTVKEALVFLEEARELIKQTNEHPDTWHIKTDQWLEKWGKE